MTLLGQAQPGRAATRSSLAWLNANDKMPRAYHDLNHAGMRAWAGLSASLGGAAWYLWVPETSSTSSDQVIFVYQATDASLPLDAVLIKINRFG